MSDSSTVASDDKVNATPALKQAPPVAAMSHHPADVFFIEDTLHKLPVSIAASVRNTYSYQYIQKGRQAANLYLLSVQDYTNDKTLLTHSDDTLRTKAERLAKICNVTSKEKSAAYLLSAGLSLPAGDTEASILARVKCAVWWEKALRRKQDREQELLSIQLGHIRTAFQPYCSTALLQRIQQRHQRSMEILQSYEAVSDEGDTCDLLAVLKGSTANPVIRRAELMVRMRGFEDYAKQQNHVAMFYTLTCPSKYHRVSGNGLNDKYHDSTPRDAQRYLCDLWACIRAKLKRDGLNVYGFRIAEPHHDGTPHWHLLLFMDQGHSEAVTATLQHYAMQEDGDEAGADKHRFEVVAIDQSKGSATGYIAKYVAKNIDGFGIDSDEETGEAASDSAQRVRAWASCWGIRQFQQIGGAPVGVWRELRRIESAPDGLLEEARQAADAGDWALYMTLQGGANIDRKAQPLRVYTVEHTDTETGEVCQNRYGEFIERVKGIALNNMPAIETRLKTWTIQSKADQSEQTINSTIANTKSHTTHDVLASVLATFTLPATDAHFLQADGFSAFPWSSVNNCTQEEADALEMRRERAAIQLESMEAVA